MNISNMSDAQVALCYGGSLDATKVVSPDVSVLPNGRYVMQYVGTSCLPHERKGYQLLRSESEDGVTFENCQKPILSLSSPDDKHYSPCLVNWRGKELLFYGLGSNGVYTIRVSEQDDQADLGADHQLVVNVSEKHLAAAHSPKVAVGENNDLVCYYTGSHSKEKIYSEQFPNFDFANGFSLFRTVSADARTFSEPEPLVIDNCSFKNVYGHNVLVEGGTTYLVFSGFDGSINRLYITKSQDGLNFSTPALLLEPDHDSQELGLYSASLVKLGGNQFRLYYGCRYFDNKWKILTRTFSLDTRTETL